MARSQHPAPMSDDDPGTGRPRRGDRPEPLVTRRDMAGWIGGTPRPGASGRWPGERLGLAQQGPTSMAGWGRRILAIVIDWFIALMLSTWWFEAQPFATLAIFALLQVLLLAVLGTTVGKRVAGIQVVRVGGAMAGPWKALIRTVLLVVVVPPFIIDADGRGLHDRVAGTVEIRM